jgi:hypothetical protein
MDVTTMANTNVQKRCLCCGAQSDSPTCPRCGEASWAAVAIVVPVNDAPKVTPKFASPKGGRN